MIKNKNIFNYISEFVDVVTGQKAAEKRNSETLEYKNLMETIHKRQEHGQFLKRVLEELHKDKVIDCNQYQGKDFFNLLDKSTRGLEPRGERMSDYINVKCLECEYVRKVHRNFPVLYCPSADCGSRVGFHFSELNGERIYL